MAITYTVIPYSDGPRNRLKAGQAVTFRIRDRALSAGERFAASKAGALVLEIDGKADDEFVTPVLVARLGRVPDEAVEALAA